MKKNMTTLFIILGLFGGLLVAISVAGYRYYSSRESKNSHQELIKQGNKIKQEINNSEKELKNGQNSIKNDIKDLNEKTDTSTNRIIDKIDNSRKQKDTADLTSVYNFKIIDTPNSPSFAELTVGLQNNSNICADNAILLISIEHPENILNGGYYSGRDFFSKNKAQLHADVVYPGITQTFEKIKVKKFDKLFIIATIVAKNMSKKHEKIYAINKDGEIKVNQFYTSGGDLYSWIEILKKA